MDTPWLWLNIIATNHGYCKTIWLTIRLLGQSYSVSLIIAYLDIWITWIHNPHKTPNWLNLHSPPATYLPYGICHWYLPLCVLHILRVKYTLLRQALRRRRIPLAVHLYNTAKCFTYHRPQRRPRKSGFSCHEAALWMVLSVCPSVRLSHLFHYVPVIVSSWNFQELMSMQKPKVRGQRSRSQRPKSNLSVSRL